MAEVDFAIETAELTKRFGAKAVVDRLDLQVPVGSIFAFLGRNGAGKTTTIRMLLNLLDRTSGDAEIFGLDCARHSLEIRRRTGYVAEGQSMYDWMTVEEIIRFCRRFYPKWDVEFASMLQTRFELPGSVRVGDLSRGMQGKLALLLAMAHRPELLVLDEPTSGLDVVVRHDFLKGALELVQDEGRTVFFSSHQVSEVERIADWVGIIDEGKLVCCSPIDDLKDNVRRITLTFDCEPPDTVNIGTVLRIEKSGRQMSITVRDYTDDIIAAAQEMKPANISVERLSLERIFIDMVA